MTSIRVETAETIRKIKEEANLEIRNYLLKEAYDQGFSTNLGLSFLGTVLLLGLGLFFLTITSSWPSNYEERNRQKAIQASYEQEWPVSRVASVAADSLATNRLRAIGQVCLEARDIGVQLPPNCQIAMKAVSAVWDARIVEGSKRLSDMPPQVEIK
jgi:hypothetical protein